MEVSLAEYIIRCCIHLVSSQLPDTKALQIGSGVIIKYKERFFICTADHVSGVKGTSIGIETGNNTELGVERYYLGDFSYVGQVDYNEDLMEMEDLLCCFDNPGNRESRFDIGFREIQPLDNILQEERSYTFPKGPVIEIAKGNKLVMPIMSPHEIDTTQICGFFGRIKPSYKDGRLHTEEILHWGKSIQIVDELFLKIDTGAPLRDYSLFKGCSGGPIIDGAGKLIGIVTHGESLSSPYIYGFRADKLLQWIELMYFGDPIADN